jgi:hypothetical protein
MLEPLITEPHQSVLVSQHQRLDLLTIDGLHNFEESLSVEIQTTSNFLDPFRVRQTASGGEFL